MTMQAGSSAEGTGLAGKMREKMEETFGKDYDFAASEKGLDAVAAAVVEYIQDNAEVSLSGPDPASVE